MLFLVSQSSRTKISTENITHSFFFPPRKERISLKLNSIDYDSRKYIPLLNSAIKKLIHFRLPRPSNFFCELPSKNPLVTNPRAQNFHFFFRLPLPTTIMVPSASGWGLELGIKSESDRKQKDNNFFYHAEEEQIMNGTRKS